MKVLYGCLVAMLLGNVAHAQLFKKKTDKVAVSTKNPNTLAKIVQQVKKAETQFFYAIFDNQASEESVKVSDVQYNKQGLPEVAKNYDFEGNLIYEHTYEYDETQRQIRRYYHSIQQVKTLDLIEYYNAAGQLLEVKKFTHDNRVLENSVIEYDALGQKMKETHSDSTQKKLYEIIYEYHSDPISCIETHTNFKTKEVFLIATNFNSNNQIVEKIRYRQTGELVHKITFLYDMQERLTEKRFYRDGKKLEVVEMYGYSSLNDELIYSMYAQEGKELVEHTVYKYQFY